MDGGGADVEATPLPSSCRTCEVGRRCPTVSHRLKSRRCSRHGSRCARSQGAPRQRVRTSQENLRHCRLFPAWPHVSLKNPTMTRSRLISNSAIHVPRIYISIRCCILPFSHCYDPRYDPTRCPFTFLRDLLCWRNEGADDDAYGYTTRGIDAVKRCSSLAYIFIVIVACTTYLAYLERICR